MFHFSKPGLIFVALCVVDMIPSVVGIVVVDVVVVVVVVVVVDVVVDVVVVVVLVVVELVVVTSPQPSSVFNCQGTSIGTA